MTSANQWAFKLEHRNKHKTCAIAEHFILTSQGKKIALQTAKQCVKDKSETNQLFSSHRS